MSPTGEVRSADGATIRWTAAGTGPPLVFVHGGLTPAAAYGRLLATLAEGLTVVAMGRRGYGVSDDGPSYSYAREADDIVAVAGVVGPPRWAFGHSSGAICVLLAATRGLDKVVLFEPPVPAGEPVFPAGAREAAEDAVARGEYAEAVTIGLRDGVKVPAPVVEALAGTPSWAATCALAPAWVREFAEIDAVADLSFCAAVEADVLVLWGSETQAHHRRAVAALAEALPRVTVECLPGRGHDAPNTAPAEVAAAVRAFLGA